MTESSPNPIPAAPLDAIQVSVNDDAGAPIAKEEAVQTEEEPMIHVHAPHEPVHSWRDAFIHIAIIAVGLLIAIALEQTVEYFHKQHLVAETREALRLEREYNYKAFAQFGVYTRWSTAEYRNNLLVLEYLQQHPGTPEEKLPGILKWVHGDSRFSYGSWETAQQSGITALMPQDEVVKDAKLYHDLQVAQNMAEEENTASHRAEAYLYQDRNPAQLTPAEVADEIQLTKLLLMQHYRYLLCLRTIEFRYPDFTSGPTNADLEMLQNSPNQQTKKLLLPAYTLTMNRMKSAGYVEQFGVYPR